MNSLIADLKNVLNNHLTTVEDVFINHQDHCKLKNIRMVVRMNDWKGILYFLQRYEYQTSIILEIYSEARLIGDKKLMNTLYPKYLECIKYKRENYNILLFRGNKSKEMAIENDDLELYIEVYSNHNPSYGYYDVRAVLEKGACSILKYILEYCNSNIDDGDIPPPIKDPRIARIIVEDLQSGKRKYIYSLIELISVAGQYKHDVVAKILSDYSEQV